MIYIKVNFLIKNFTLANQAKIKMVIANVCSIRYLSQAL